MNYVVAGLLLGRLPEAYTNITEITAVVDDAANTEDDADNGLSNSGSAEPALYIVKAAVDTDAMPGKCILHCNSSITNV
jgi:hypothetical protein